ncbi:hypothetical protein N2152v2_002330 [Parachlorella kessleri]
MDGEPGESQAGSSGRQEPAAPQPTNRAEEQDTLAHAPAQEAGAQSAEQQQSCLEARVQSAEQQQSCSEEGATSGVDGSRRSTALGTCEAEKPTEWSAEALCSLRLLVREDGRVRVDIICVESQPPALSANSATQGSNGTVDLLQQEKLAAAQAHMEAHRQSFLSFIAQAAEAAKRGTTGPSKAAHLNEAMQGFQVLEPPKAAEVQALRLKNADLQHDIERIERKLKDSDRLSDGLHLIDFEQLKIENSTLSYKTEALSSEVQKLRGKLTQTIQMAAHSKEKLYCVSEEKRCLEERLQATEEQLTRARLDLAAAKARREALQGTRANLRKDWDRITDGRCLADMKGQDLKLAELQAKRDQLQRTYTALTATALRK